jgi:EAL domain-containing protein (putative c-di-GMP-specific phosphodiesterase class I)
LLDDPPTDPKPGGHANVVSLFAHATPQGRLERHAGVLRRAFRPLAGIRRGAPDAWEVLVAAPGAGPASPATWSDRGRAEGATAVEVEAEVAVAALRARRQIPPGALLQLEVSARALLTRPVQRALRAAGRLDGVLLAVVEGPEPFDALVLGAALESPRQAGAAIVLDEAEGGHAALRRLASLRPDFIRVDATLCADPEDPAGAGVLAALVDFADRVDAGLIAEDVSSVAQLRTLAEAGVAHAGGPLIGGPAETPEPPAAGPLAALSAVISPSDDLEGVTLEALVEPLPTVAVDAALEVLADVFLADAAHDYAVLVEPDGRPAALAERAGFLRAEPYEHPVLWATPSSPLRPVARRAMLRPPLERFAPLVCCDRAGRFIGVVRVERLVRALAAEPAGDRTEPPPAA